MSLKLIILLAVATAAFGAVANISITRTSDGSIHAPGDLIFEDNFDTLDLNKWHHEVSMSGGGNAEFQIYDKAGVNSFVRDGSLFIKPTLSLDRFNGDYEMLYNGDLALEGCTEEDVNGSGCKRKAWYPNILPPACSARLRTKGSFSFTYGRVEVRAKMPSGDYTWPAIWMLPEDSVYGGWPSSGEMDISESRGNRKLFENGENVGSERAGQTLHFGPGWPHNGWSFAHGEMNTPADQGFDRDFHLFQLEWTDSYIKFSIDDKELKTVTPPEGGFYELGQFPPDTTNPWIGADNFKMAPFDQNFHIILNVAVGGNFFPENAKNFDAEKNAEFARPWKPGSGENFLDFWYWRDLWLNTWADDRSAMQVDYVRVYAV